MSFLADIHSYWSTNATLTSAIPANKVWTGVVPEGTSFPYVLIIPVATIPTFLTGASHFETFTFQISIYDTDPDNCESVGATVVSQFDFQSIATGYISLERTNGPFLMVDTDTPQLTYHCWIQYDYNKNIFVV